MRMKIVSPWSTFWSVSKINLHYIDTPLFKLSKVQAEEYINIETVLLPSDVLYV